MFLKLLCLFVFLSFFVFLEDEMLPEEHEESLEDVSEVIVSVDGSV